MTTSLGPVGAPSEMTEPATGASPSNGEATGIDTTRTSGASRPTEPRRKIRRDGSVDRDPRPTPITLLGLLKLARKTLRAERAQHVKLDRPVKLTSKRLAASILPSLERPLFIVGAARSGTTFLGDCLGRLPEISYHHEPPATKAAGRYVYEGLWGERRARFFYRTVYAWLIRTELEGGLRFADKTPTNALLIPFLRRSFSDAQFIHIVRDGRDAAASHMEKPWLRRDSLGSGVREPGGYLHGPYAQWWVEPERRDKFAATSDAHRMIWAWRRYVEAALRDGPPLGPEQYLELRYETLVRQPRDSAETILDFLRIDRRRSREQFVTAVGRADASSIGSWRRKFSAEEIAQIEADSGDLLRSLGYE